VTGFKPMLFNSSVFIGVFLPLVLLGFYALAATGTRRPALLWLTLSSLVFYGWWNPANLPLIAASLVCNFVLGQQLIKRPSRAKLYFGVTVNLLFLGYYKYTGFLVDNLEDLLGVAWSIDTIVLPLAISFFTFQQIAYLSDAHDGAVAKHSFLDYSLFITFFPQLIAGPITHQREMIEQFRNPAVLRLRWECIALGATLFLLGLFKKVVFADNLGEIASPIFATTADGGAPALTDAWTGALTYTLQIYFDFSGYSDMAIGLALLFGMRIPVNFDSPFKAHNVIEFWSRWHMTLTRFLTAYVYNPIVLRITRARAGAGKPLPRRGKMTPATFVALIAYPTVFTMFLSGIWHGAGWQFIVFGLLHGFYLVVAHGWRAYKTRKGLKLDSDVLWHRAAAVLLTFVSVVIAMVFFRAPDVPTALRMLAGMVGANGWVPPPELGFQMPVDPARGLRQVIGDMVRSDFFLIAVLLAFVWTLPNTQQWMGKFQVALGWRPREHWLASWLPITAWRPSPALGAALGVVGFLALARAFSAAPTEFLYFQF
jgi:alginate O-acetyltransferase complex protein AlgI